MPSKAKIAAGIIVALLLLGGGLTYYSYSRIDVYISSVSLASSPIKINTAKALLIGLSAIMTGGLSLPAMIDAIEGINLVIYIKAYNGGILPVYIPTISYDLYINNNYVGEGSSDREVTIQPGDSEIITVYQFIDRDSLLDVAMSIVNNNGEADIKAKGEAKASILGLSFSIPFEKTTTINVYEEIKKALINFLSGQGGGSQGSGQPPTQQPGPQTGRLEVSAIYWVYNGEYVYEVPQGSNVMVKVVLTAVGGDVEGLITVRVKKDLALMPDQVYTEHSEYISLNNGESTTIEFWFTAKDKSGLTFRGYFIEIVLPDGTTWTMESDYPPRLKVT